MRGGVGLGCKLVWQAMVTCMLFMLAWSARAAEITYDKPYPTAGYISIKGDIEDFDRQKFSALLAEHPDTRMVVLESPGGRLGPALEIGAIIRQTRMWTAALGECASACAYIWMAGKPLVVSADTELGFHSPYNAQDDSSISSVGNALVGAYLNQLGYPANVITYATSAKPNEMQWLTPRDAVLLGLDITYVTNLQQLLSTLAGTAVQTTQEHEAGPAQTSAAQPDDGSGDDESYDVPTSPPDEEWKLAIYKNVDFWGGDKYPKGLTLQSRRDCMEQCANDTDCKLFTYNESYKLVLHQDQDGHGGDGGKPDLRRGLQAGQGHCAKALRAVRFPADPWPGVGRALQSLRPAAGAHHRPLPAHLREGRRLRVSHLQPLLAEPAGLHRAAHARDGYDG